MGTIMRFITKYLLIGLTIGLSACNTGSTNSAPTSFNGWIWVSGSKQSNAYGTYGVQGVASPANIPGGRYIAVNWVDNGGDFWMFGGTGNAMAGESGNLNDLWKYSRSSNQWTWVGGSDTANAYGLYGTQGEAATDNIPGARLGAVSW